MLKGLFYKNIQAIKTYWPIFLLIQLPIFVVYLTNQKPNIQASIILDKNNQQQAIQIKRLERRFEELKKRFLALQIQHAKFVKSSILMASKVQHDNSSGVGDTKKIALDIVDRIGEKIRLNESYLSLLTLLPKECSLLPGYEILQQFASKLPLNLHQLKKSFEKIQKRHAQTKIKSDLPKWLEQIASLFHGKIKIEKTPTQDENSFELVMEALDTQDLKSALSFANNIPQEQIRSWTALVIERMQLEEGYAKFSVAMQQWAQQISPKLSTNKESTP